MIPERGPQTANRELERERPDGTTGPRDHAGTPDGATGPSILDPGTPNLSQAGDEGLGQTGAKRDHGTTGPRGHTERGHRATDSGSWDHQSKPGWGRGTGPDGGQTGPRDHGTTRAHRMGPPGNRFWIWAPMIYANHQSKNPISASWGLNTKSLQSVAK